MKFTALTVAAVLSIAGVIAAEPSALRVLADSPTMTTGNGAAETNLEPIAGEPKEAGDKKEHWGRPWGRPWGCGRGCSGRGCGRHWGCCLTLHDRRERVEEVLAQPVARQVRVQRRSLLEIRGVVNGMYLATAGYGYTGRVTLVEDPEPEALKSFRCVLLEMDELNQRPNVLVLSLSADLVITTWVSNPLHHGGQQVDIRRTLAVTAVVNSREQVQTIETCHNIGAHISLQRLTVVRGEI